MKGGCEISADFLTGSLKSFKLGMLFYQNLMKEGAMQQISLGRGLILIDQLTTEGMQGGEAIIQRQILHIALPHICIPLKLCGFN